MPFDSLSQTILDTPAYKSKAVRGVPDLWIKKQKVKYQGFNIANIMRNREVKGDIGIEVEVEGNKFPKDSSGPKGSYGAWKADLIPPQWKYHHDGSLRGEDNAEYVFYKPLTFEEVPQAVGDLWNMFKEAECILDESNRTSVHVHLNAQRWHLNRLVSFSAIYFMLEELLTEWCGDHRVGNLFCLRAKDAPAIVSKLKNFVVNDGRTQLSDGLHYAGLNVQALCKFGSIEIRSLRGCTDPQTILDWVSILERIYKVSADFPDPRAVCDGFSGEGPMAYLHRILGDKAKLVVDGVKWDNQRIIESLYEGIRLAQDLCYCREWSEYEPLDISPDPFDRSPQQVAAGLGSYTATLEQQLINHYQTMAANILSTGDATASTSPVSPTAPDGPVDIYIPEPDSDEDDDWIVDPLDYFDDEE